MRAKPMVILYKIRLNPCHCDRREAIARTPKIQGIASFRCAPFAMTCYNGLNGLDIISSEELDETEF